MKSLKRKILSINFVILFLTIITILLSIGWSAFNSSMIIGSYAYVREQSEVRVTNFSLSSATNNGIGTYENFGVDFVTANATLPEANSTITYEVEVTNMQIPNGVTVGILSATGLPEGLSILSWSGYNLKDKICDDNNVLDCGSGAQKTFYITVGYTNSSYFNSSKTDYIFDINFTFRNFHSLTYNNISGNHPSEILDGDDLSIVFNNTESIEIKVEGVNEYTEGIEYSFNNGSLTVNDVSENLTITKLPSYTITYDANGGHYGNNSNDTTNDVKYVWRNNRNNIVSGTEKTPTKGSEALYNWYLDNINYDTIFDLSSEINQSRIVYAKWLDKTAEINGVFYNTLQAAIDAVPTTNTETTVILLRDTSEVLTVNENKKIVFDFRNNTLRNNGNNPVINNKGTITITNGNIITNASSNGAVNNQSTGNITISGGRITVIQGGGRQALWNNGGRATIMGNAYLSSTATARAAVQNVTGGVMAINGGTIISTGSNAVNNAGSMTIGLKDGDINYDSPILQAVDNGIYATAGVNFYDGIIKYKNEYINDSSKIVDVEGGYGFLISQETINGDVYKTARLGIGEKIIFDPNGGSVSESTRTVAKGEAIGPLPIPVRNNFTFLGWFTGKTSGEQITQYTIINNDNKFFAHWEKIGDIAAIGDTLYDSLQEAINAAPANTQTTIRLLKNTAEVITVNSSKNIIFDFGNYTLSNYGSTPVIENSGIISIISGSINSSADQGAINNLAGRLNMSGGEIITTSNRQAIYITGGTVEISGTAYLRSAATGTPSGGTMTRGTIQNISGTLIITGGTIIGTRQQAISNESTLTIGTQDDNINTNTPVIQGETYGIMTTGTFNFYDGVIKGKTATINGTITLQENNSQLVNTTINNYKTTYLELLSE